MARLFETTTYHIMADSFSEEISEYCRCERRPCSCNDVPVGIVKRIAQYPKVHERFLTGTFRYCNNGDCETCLTELPF